MTLNTLALPAAALALALTTGLAHADDIVRTGPNGGQATIHWSHDNGIVTRQVDRIGPRGATSSATTRCGIGGRLCGTRSSGVTANGGAWSSGRARIEGPRAVRRYGTFTGPRENTYNWFGSRRK